MLRIRAIVACARTLALTFIATLIFASTLPAQEWADLQVTFVYDAAKAPERTPVDMSKDGVCVQAHPDAKPLSEELLVDPATMGIKNVAFYPDIRKSGITLDDAHPSLKVAGAEPVALDNNKCTFVPHIIAVRPGQSIKVLNSDQTGHNANFVFFNNQGVNPLIPPGGSKDIPTSVAEPAPVSVECSIHPWMKAYIVMLELPYTGISNEKGVLKIEKLPVGKPIKFKVWHENMDKSIDEVNFAGKDAQWPKGNIDLTLKPGMNDLGVVKIKPSEFKTK